MLLAYTICTEMSGNGVLTTGTKTMKGPLLMEALGWIIMRINIVYCAVVLGSTFLITAVVRIAMAMLATSLTICLACVSSVSPPALRRNLVLMSIGNTDRKPILEFFESRKVVYWVAVIIVTGLRGAKRVNCPTGVEREI